MTIEQNKSGSTQSLLQKSANREDFNAGNRLKSSNFAADTKIAFNPFTSPLPSGPIPTLPPDTSATKFVDNVEKTASSTMDVVGSIWNLGRAGRDGALKVKALVDVKKQVTEFALSYGQTKIDNIKISPRDSKNIVVLTSQESSKSLTSGSFAVDIEYDSELLGQKIKSKWTVWMTPGFFGRVGTPYVNAKNKNPETGSKPPPSGQNVLRGGWGEGGIQGFIGLRRIPGTSSIDFLKNKDTSGFANLGFSSTLRLASVKQVNDYNPNKTSDKYVETPSVGISLDFSTFASIGPLRLGPYVEGGFRFGRRSRIDGPPEPTQKNTKLGLFFIDPCNVGLNPAFAKYALEHGASKEMIEVGSRALEVKAKQAGTSSAIRFLGYGVEKLLPQAVRTAVFLAEAAEPIGWAIALGTTIWEVYQVYDEKKKRDYHEKVLKAVKNKLYDPQIGIPVTLKALSDSKQPYVGNAARFMSDVVDEACKQNLANPADMFKKWEKSLNFKGNNLTQTQYGRIIAGGVLGRTDVISDVLKQFIPRDKSGKTIHTGQIGLQDKLDNSIVVLSLKEPEKLKSKLLGNGSNVNYTKYDRVGAPYNSKVGYRKFKAKFMGGTVEAEPGQANDRGTALWKVTLTTRDGLRANLDVSLTGAFSLKQFLSGDRVKKALENNIAAQRSKLKKPPPYLMAYKDNLFGGQVAAMPVFVQPDGQIMWKVNAKSSSGVLAEIYETLDHQFGKEDLQPGHYFRIKLEDIMRSNQ